MNDPHYEELSELFSRESEALVDEAFVQRCVTSFRRAQRRLLILELIVVCAATGIVALVLPWLGDLAATVSSRISASFAAFDVAAIVPSWLSAAVAVLDSTFGGIDRAIAVGVALVLMVRLFGLRLFRLRQSQP